MKKSFLILVLFSLTMNGHTQPLILEWQNCFGGPLDDFSRDVVGTGDGFMLAADWGPWDIWLVKTDLSGNQLWERKYGGSDQDGCKRLLSMKDGSFILIGSANSSDGDIGSDPYPGSANYWIIKVNDTGNILWEKIYGGSCRDRPWDGLATSDGGIVAFGFTCSADGDVSNFFGSYDVWMIKLDSSGNRVWDYTIGTIDADVSSAIIETSDRGFLVAASSTPTTGGNIDCVPYNENAEIVLFKVDSMANFEWQKCFGGSDHESVFDMIETADGYLLACSAYSNDGEINGAGYHVGFDVLGNATADVWLVKLDFSGNIVWNKCYGGSSGDVPRRIFHSSDGGFIIFANAQSFDGDVSGNHSSGNMYSDIWVFKINSTGDLIWQQCFGGNGNEKIESGVFDNGDGSYVIASTIYDFNSGQVECPTTNESYQAWLIKVTDTTFLSVPENPFAGNAIKVYPNPANEYVVFEVAIGARPNVSLPENQQTIPITDLCGRPVAQVPVTGDKTIWDTRGVMPGIYLYRFESDGKIAVGKIMIGW